MNILLRGGGDLASGVALRLHRAGLTPLITEIEQPLAVRRLVSFAEAVYRGSIEIEGVRGRKAEGLEQAFEIRASGGIPVLVDPEAGLRHSLRAEVIIDARMIKRPPELGIETAPLVIGLGPGFTAGENCHAVIETNRGHLLGRVIWQGSAEPNTGIPEGVGKYRSERVLRSPADGVLEALAELGQKVEAGQPVAAVSGQLVTAPFQGVLRGLLHPGLPVRQGLKIGDVDPRGVPEFAYLVSDKSLAIGGGVLEAILSREDLRPRLWDDNESGYRTAA